MEEKRLKILKEKDENLFPLQLTNATGQTQYVNLFNSDTLTGISFNPSPSNLPNTSLGNFVYPFTGGYTAFNTSNGDIYIGNFFSHIIYVYDSNLTLITSIVLGFPFSYSVRSLVYNSSNNTMYVIPVSGVGIKIIDCSTYSVISTLIPPITNFIAGEFCPFNNSLYITTNIGFVLILDSTLTFSVIPVSPQPYFIVYDSIHNRMYFGDNVTSVMDYIDCSTNTYVPISILFPPFGFIPIYGSTFCPVNNLIYVNQGVSNTITIFDTNSNSFVPSLSFSVLSTASTIVYDSNQQLIYVSYTSNQIVYFNPLINLELGVFNSISPSTALTFNPLNNQLSVISNATNIFEVFTTANVYSVPYFVQGIYDYNAFVNNLNNEPISIQLIRVTTQNQQQLNNEIQITTIDSSGKQTFYSEFPIVKIDTMQSQGNIADIPFDDVIFDGRTYINQYELQPYEIVRFGIYYKQIDLSTASATLPMFFKKKIPLKEYINNELNL